MCFEIGGSQSRGFNFLLRVANEDSGGNNRTAVNAVLKSRSSSIQHLNPANGMVTAVQTSAALRIWWRLVANEESEGRECQTPLSP